jgi:hypothetical protein
MVQEKGQLPQASALRVPFVTFQRTRDTRSSTLPILGSRKPVSTHTPPRKRLRGAEISPLGLPVGGDLTTLFLQSRLLTTMLQRDELASRTRLPCGVRDDGRCPASHRIIDIAFTLRARRAVPAKDGLGTEMFDPIQGD